MNEELTEELHKPVIKKTRSRKVYARFKGNTWATDLAVIGSLSSTNRKVKNF